MCNVLFFFYSSFILLGYFTDLHIYSTPATLSMATRDYYILHNDGVNNNIKYIKRIH